MVRRRGTVIFVLYLIFGLYLVNLGFQFVKIPTFISSFDKWITLVGGIGLILGGINFLRLKRYVP